MKRKGSKSTFSRSSAASSSSSPSSLGCWASGMRMSSGQLAAGGFSCEVEHFASAGKWSGRMAAAMELSPSEGQAGPPELEVTSDTFSARRAVQQGRMVSRKGRMQASSVRLASLLSHEALQMRCFRPRGTLKQAQTRLTCVCTWLLVYLMKVWREYRLILRATGRVVQSLRGPFFY